MVLKRHQGPLLVRLTHMPKQAEVAHPVGVVDARLIRMQPATGRHRHGTPARERPIHTPGMAVKRQLGMLRLAPRTHTQMVERRRHGMPRRERQIHTVQMTADRLGVLTMVVELLALHGEPEDGTPGMLDGAGALLHLLGQRRHLGQRPLLLQLQPQVSFPPRRLVFGTVHLPQCRLALRV